MMTTDTTGIITDVNQQMVDLTGRTRDELIGAPCRNLFTNPTRADTLIARVLQQDRVSDHELAVRSCDGAETVVSFNAATLRDRDRIVQGVFAAARDVTESKRSEPALLEKKSKLEQGLGARSEYVARAEAEVLTPLRAVVSSSDAPRSGVDGKLSGAQQQRIDGICADGELLLSLLVEIIGMFTVETGVVEFDHKSGQVRSLLVASAELANKKTVDSPVSFTVDSAADLSSIPLAAASVEKMLAVMLGDAVVASMGGSVTVQARTVPRSAVGAFNGDRPHWSCPLPEFSFTEFLEIRVTDTGSGISRGDLCPLFLSLSHGEFNAARKLNGNGVGSTTVKLLAELHDGAVVAQGALGEGATFAVWLPRRVLPTVPGRPAPESNRESARPAAGSTHSASDDALEHDENVDPLPQHATQDLIGAANADSSVHLQGLAEAVAGLMVPSGHPTALVVEDDPKSAKLVRLLLEAEGFQVIVASSGEEALDLARGGPLSLITLDVQLPGMDGWKFLLKLHDSPELASIPVVVIAGLTNMSMALRRGAAAVLEKPLQRAELQNSLTLLGLLPERSQARCILIVDEDRETVDQVISYLEQPAYRVESSATGEAAITDALKLTPDLILINLMMEGMGGFKIVRALQRHISTQHIPVLVMSTVQITDEEQDTIDSDPAQPVVAMNTPDFNRDALLAEIKRALG
ncbi:PAS domain S-box-containing protein [Cryobacterium sp. CAN_C2]